MGTICFKTSKYTGRSKHSNLNVYAIGELSLFSVLSVNISTMDDTVPITNHHSHTLLGI